jgi:NAD(P)-dependent dehydrogenase (short-subunit alcohol dehydrogenase family)
MQMEIDLTGRVALVTGGSRGIGKAIAAAFAGAGAKVMITSRKVESCEEACAEIGAGVEFEAGHIGRDEDRERVIDATIERLGGLDILVNNAATNPYAGLTIDVDRPRWDKTIEINLTAPLMWIQSAWRKSMQERGGVVLNISSVGGLSTSPILGTYDVTKAALIHLTKQLAAELGPGVRVNAIAPGLVKTDFARTLWEGEGADRAIRGYPLKRLGTPEDIAAAATYLASEGASWITGQTLVLDGGGLIGFRR